jgi:hypothetical protein
LLLWLFLYGVDNILAMSTPRNKRKRPEIDSETASPLSRRRSREQRASAETEPVTDDKNEQLRAARQQQETIEGDGNTVPDMDTSKSQQDLTAGDNASMDSNGANTRTGKEGLDQTNADPGSGTSQNENSSTQPASVDIEPSSTTGVEGSEEDEATKFAGNDRASRIRALLSHRRTLLLRMKLCRSNAQHRLRNELSDNTKNIGKLDETSKPSRNKEEKLLERAPIISETDDEEIAAFREMTRIATAEAKKNRAGPDGMSEKRTSLSLRRGSSVGKRMNAALSSLAPGSSAHETGDTLSEHGEHAAAGTEQSKSKPAALPQAMGIPPNTQFDAIAPPRGPLALAAAVSIAPTVVRPIKSAATAPLQRQALVGGPVKIEPGQKIRAPNNKSVKNAPNAVARMSSTARADAATTPLHLGALASILPQNRLAQPKANFPEAVALREQRNKVRSKLSALLEMQKQSVSMSDEKISSVDSAATEGSRKSKSRPTALHPEVGANLPRRRKTHWDHVLQEMAWMATDFIEERKWKLSAARTLGSTMLAPGFVPISRKLVKVARDKKSSGLIANNETARKLKTLENSSSFVKPSAGRIVCQDIRQFVTPSLEDSKTARRVAFAISGMIQEIGTASLEAGALCQSDHEHVAALYRYRNLRDNLLKDNPAFTKFSNSGDDKKLVATDDEGDEKEIAAIAFDNGEETQPKAASVEKPLAEITTIIERCVRKASEIRNVSVSPGREGKGPDCLFALSSVQNEAFEFMKNSWDSEECMGTILSGSAASGKTLLACTLIWNQRSLGPQMVVCPPASVVSSGTDVFSLGSLKESC